MSDREQEVQLKDESVDVPINIKIVNSQGEEVFFKIMRSTKLNELRDVYANKMGKDVSGIRFLYDGYRVNDDDTPASLEMEEGDAIDIMVGRSGD